MKEALKKALPQSTFLALKKFKDKIKKIRRPLEVLGPVAQMYINDGEIESFLGINDYYSYLISENNFETLLKVAFYDQSGKLILKQEYQLKSLSTISISVKEIFKKHNLQSNYGLLTTELTPKKKHLSLARLGPSASHFFMFYKGNHGSVSHTHPSSVLTKQNTKSGEFLSNQLIFKKGLKEIVLYQANPSFHEVEIEHGFKGVNGLISLKKHILPPLSVEKIIFKPDEMPGQDPFNIYVNPLPTSNSKPMLMRVYENQQFSMSHS